MQIKTQIRENNQIPYRVRISFLQEKVLGHVRVYVWTHTIARLFMLRIICCFVQVCYKFIHNTKFSGFTKILKYTVLLRRERQLPKASTPSLDSSISPCGEKAGCFCTYTIVTLSAFCSPFSTAITLVSSLTSYTISAVSVPPVTGFKSHFLMLTCPEFWPWLL